MVVADPLSPPPLSGRRIRDTAQTKGSVHDVARLGEALLRFLNGLLSSTLGSNSFTPARILSMLSQFVGADCSGCAELRVVREMAHLIIMSLHDMSDAAPGNLAEAAASIAYVARGAHASYGRILAAVQDTAQFAESETVGARSEVHARLSIMCHLARSVGADDQGGLMALFGVGGAAEPLVGAMAALIREPALGGVRILPCSVLCWCFY